MNFRTTLFIAFLASQLLAAPEKLVLHFFGSSTCGECMEIKEVILKPMAKQYADKIDLRLYDTEDTATMKPMIAFEKAYRVTKPSPQELFFGDTMLISYDTIMPHAKALLEHYVANPAKWVEKSLSVDTTSSASLVKQRFEQFTFTAILVAGLIDGINPCAIATMIFLVSFLATQKRKRNEILMIGMSFTAAVFLTYLGLGIGAFEVLTFLKEYRWISLVIKWGAVAFAGIVAIICFYDAIVYAITKDVKEIKNQLPKVVKLQIHKVISGNLSTKKLISGAFVAGFLVTLLEAVCTGQVYLPTIILMTRQNGLKLTGWLYLVFYNFLFVLPLIIVMILAYFGMTWSQLAKSAQKHMTLLKVLVGLILTGLALFLAFSM